jgi:hypothetical protein
MGHPGSLLGRRKKAPKPAKAGDGSVFYGMAEAVPFLQDRARTRTLGPKRSDAATRAKAQILLSERLSGFENPLPRTEVRGWHASAVVP